MSRYRDRSGKSVREQIESDAAMFGIGLTIDVNGKKHFKLRCEHCGRPDETFNSSFDHVNEIAAHFRKAGWILGWKEKPYCSTAHARKAEQEKKNARKDEQMKQTPTGIVATAPPPATATAIAAAMPIPAIGSDIRMTLRVGRVLEEHFDRTKRLYRAGWGGDERVAKETGAALDFVIKVRKEDFGELAEDPEDAKMRAAIEAMEVKIMALSGELDELKARHERHVTGKHHKAQG